MKVLSGIEEAKEYVGKEVGVSPWYDVTQERINAFADATGDHQWIHRRRGARQERVPPSADRSRTATSRCPWLRK